ncbi:KpsF/GutQ family sugar-phosphate isomerase [Mucilaginibacter phyllosphaerae]|uniref:Arabinose-5-phosphate isomerase n=1 Tax=Mucilaginibacter phyllosphaerae TaxID=1812349 RepID=A0A4Y8AHW9_9SPHI|nr:KpsF/GutQ family sugar-phosphate isomerase [Mucilaginibacter phyllosphaerae]MBB3968621.1 arabinose-5-phosphate isomerase [Mucilaginibacter phyllosphaerae]TEW67741.1 KpsF/GutQ family sugar-phosphate isomerase [Mucilaginibacter phyllosphaerae]GGH14877.1 capsule expression protein [Mucilaginibacter phyllosphaerae]
MKSIAQKVFDIEIASLQYVALMIDDEFSLAVDAILRSAGKLVVCGMGKSGHIAKKISATFTSTGTPSFFMHPAEAFHGDLGMISASDVVLLVSYSGETEEVLKIVPYLQYNKNTFIAITGNPLSTLAKNATYHLSVCVKQEACPLELAPTSSTTATLVMGDALAVALMTARDFSPADFARFHPGGRLGRKLLVRVKDLMRTDKLPFIDTDATFTQLVLQMSEGKLGMVIVGTSGKVHGIITDGDLRRGLVKYDDIYHLPITSLMNPNPMSINEHELVYDAEELMMKHKITTLLVHNDAKVLTGVYQIFNQA